MSARIPTIEAIQQAAAREFGVPAQTMRQPAPHGTGHVGINTYQHSRPRQAAMALAVLLTGHSSARIGHFFGGRDPTTVRHAHLTVAKRRLSDAELHAKMRRITREVVGF